MNKFIAILFISTFSLPISANETADRDKVIQLVDSLLDTTQKTMLDIDIEKTKESALKALELSDGVQYHEGQLRSCYVIGQALFHNQNFNQALSYLSRAEKVKNKERYPLYLTQVYKVKGQIFFYMEMLDQAADEFDRALKAVAGIERTDHREYLTIQIYESYITMYTPLDDPESAGNYLQKAIRLLESSQNESFLYPGKINIYSLAGKYHLLRNDSESAMFYLNQAVSLIDKYSYRYKSFTLRLIGDLLIEEKQFSQALDKYFEALDNAQELGLRGEFAELNGEIAQAYQKLGISDSAAYYENRKYQLENDLLKEKISSVDNVLQMLVGDELNSTRANKEKLLITVVVALMLLLVVFRLIWTKRQRKIMQSVEKETKQLKRKLNTAFDEVLELAKKNDPAFIVRFSEIYPDFWTKLINKYPDLTTAEQQLCAMTYLNFSTKQIAEYTYVQIRSVQTRRSRLRKNINLSSDVDLYKHLMSL